VKHPKAEHMKMHDRLEAHRRACGPCCHDPKIHCNTERRLYDMWWAAVQRPARAT